MAEGIQQHGIPIPWQSDTAHSGVQIGAGYQLKEGSDGRGERGGLNIPSHRRSVFARPERRAEIWIDDWRHGDRIDCATDRVGNQRRLDVDL
ncbi:MAG TPA: hypothetical protein EYQ75_00365 [Planctomycetaceae bacterium]|nr:hypothetical protein [Planctomycetaceae bacterium]